MPNGYTAEIYDGKDVTFKQFALTCARAFGPCIMQRDDPLDVPPMVQMPSDYHERALIQARNELGEIQSMSPEDCQAMADAEYDEAMARRHKYIVATNERRARYDGMIAKVADWTPQTAEHVEFKTFMLNTLHESKKWDCGEPEDELTFWATPKKIDGETWRKDKVNYLRESIEHHTEEHEKEVTRTAGRNKWITDLLDDLKGRND